VHSPRSQEWIDASRSSGASIVPLAPFGPI
jgi:hypothetical protein